jgi:hypothetical protein
MKINFLKKEVNLDMLMDIKCSAVTSIKVNLTFDDEMNTNTPRHKVRIIGVGDLVDIIYNANGLRKHIEGKVCKVSAVGSDPTSWYIIVDGSDDFESDTVKFSPMSILDVDISRKADTLDFVRTVIGGGGVPFLRIVKGRLEWSKDCHEWFPIVVDSRDIIEDQEGTVPIAPPPHYSNNDDQIEDAEY